MSPEKQKELFIHWYYSVSEWEQFTKLGAKRLGIMQFMEPLAAGLCAFLLVYFLQLAGWFPAFGIGIMVIAVYIFFKYYLRKKSLTWKGSKVPEVTIRDGVATINDMPVVFHGNGRWLRKVDIKEAKSLNILEFTYEWKTGEGAAFNELQILVPKGRLREAVELVNSLNLEKSTMKLVE